MNEKRLKYIFYFFSALLLTIMLLISRDAGISCDEVLHYNQSVSVYNYFKTQGADQSALNTPVTYLKYYGQSYDNLVTILTRLLNIEDVYRFRNLMSAAAGWLAIFVTALFAIWLSGYGTAIITLILFALSPTFLGHSLNNLKDIPFALGYIASTFLIIRYFESGRKNSALGIALLTAGIAFSLSIRAGGLVLICYLFFALFIFYLIEYIKNRRFDIPEIGGRLIWITCISIFAWILAIVLWPYALQSPVKNMISSYKIMAHFPCTFRQIFEGKVEWSDFMPWYYLLKSMAITFPLAVLSGLVLFFIFIGKLTGKNNIFKYGILVFTVVFPLVFVVCEKSNLYSSWRQFLFLYPALVLLAATGFFYFMKSMKRKFLRWGAVLVIVLFGYHPLKFMISNHPYHYLYYNQFVGGLRGAYGNYETDYYFTGQTRASEWLIDYLKSKGIAGPLKVSATYSVQWQFRNHPEIAVSYIRNEERSMSDWDYAIITNRYITPFQLKNKIWPPSNAIHVIYADSIPVCAVLERKSKDDLYGYNALSAGGYKEAINYYQKVLTINDGDEMIFFNFAAALYNDKQYLRADSVLKKGLEINPDFEPILMYLGNIAKYRDQKDEAIRYYQNVIKVNRKYFEAYIGLSELLAEGDVIRARSLLRTCLSMSPRYKPAITALADTYRKTNPEMAKKYDDLANTIN